MHFRKAASFLLILPLILLLFSCEKSSTGDRSFLSFSDDTVYFDTVFSTIGSTTRELRIRNNENSTITIDEIFLSGGAGSPFRLNIDGVPAVSQRNIELSRGDSIYIFVDVFVDPLNSNSPVAVTDSIIFRVAGTEMKVQLLAWGQDIILLEDRMIGSETWDSLKPYLIYGRLTLDTLETLSVGPGTRIFFHKNASLILAGSINISGTHDSPVLLASDRTEDIYEDVPGMWSGLFILNTSKGNRINNAIIRNSVNGIHLGEVSVTTSVADLKLLNTTVYHSTITALAVINGNIEVANSVFSHCGKYCVSIRAGGNYLFTHCTIFNQWDWGFRLTPSLFVSEKPVLTGGATTQLYLDVNNSVIYGNLNSEIGIVPAAKSFAGNYFFDHCLIKLDTIESGFWLPEHFPGVQVNVNPKFIDFITYDFRPDTLSPLVNRGDPKYMIDYPDDIRAASRLTDGLPDIGSYERITGEHKKIK